MSQENAEQVVRLSRVESPRQNSQPKYLQIPNLSQFQHYKERNPPWVKLYAYLLEDYEFQQLPDATKYHFCMLLLASRCQNKIPNDSHWVGMKIGATEPVDLDTLLRIGFLEPVIPQLQKPAAEGELPFTDEVKEPGREDASNMLATCKHVASTETETAAEAETEAETQQSSSAPDGAKGRCCGCCGKNVFSRFSYGEALTLAQGWQAQGRRVGGRHIENAGGLARTLHQDGTADDEIEALLHPPAPLPKRAFTGQPCTRCFGSKQEVVQGKGARPCEHCRDEHGARTGCEPSPAEAEVNDDS